MLLASPYRTGTDGHRHVVPCAPSGVSVERIQTASKSTGNGSVDAFLAHSGTSVHPADEEWAEIEARFERWWIANHEVASDETKAYKEALKVLLRRPTVGQKCIRILEAATGLEIGDCVGLLREAGQKRKQKKLDARGSREDSDDEFRDC